MCSALGGVATSPDLNIHFNADISRLMVALPAVAWRGELCMFASTPIVAVCALQTSGARLRRNFRNGQSRKRVAFGWLRRAGGLQALLQQVFAVHEKLLLRNLAGIDVGGDDVAVFGELSLIPAGAGNPLAGVPRFAP